MKKLLFLVAIAMFAVTANAQDIPSDSCYVYTYLHWQGKGYRAYGGMLQLNADGEDRPITDDSGETLEFSTWLYAMNYLSTRGWEFVSFDEKNPEAINDKDRYILIRKRMPVSEALQYSEPSKRK